MKKINSSLFNSKRCFIALFMGIMLCLSSSAFAAARTWTGLGANTDWTTVGNWDGGTTLPATGDQITIAGVYTVTVSTNVGTFNKLTLQTAAAGGPTLVITSSGILSVTNSTTTNQTQVVLQGGIIQNAGTLNITSFTGTS